MIDRLGVPFLLLHRNEVTDAAVREQVAESGLPVVLALDADGSWRTVLGREVLRRADGSVAEFERLLAAQAVSSSG
ncbi:hypothetical protein [Agromyces marinus]|uniref:Uncharacterized protein n=1 Tax=Agromyces marinus TaxID=1389020 RepID=A0ABM8H2Y2_9MICO|nr:hypothetical protein [Agromyces marinus]UIP59782.1 hypothetical protein DSM26151_26960 [Agromyces marinus]BDZ55134.1 hypothetical protein GCM10025870_22070 [Agromyces marinus]